MKRLALSTLTALAVALPATAPQAHAAGSDRELATAVARLERAELTYDRAELLRSIDAFTARASRREAAALDHYYLARAYFPLIELYESSGDAAGAEKAGEKGLEHARKAVEKDPKNADGYRLLGDFYGRLTGFKSMLARMSYGGKSQKHHKTALEMAPTSPLALIGVGSDKLYAPPGFGGDRQAALDLFRQAAAVDGKAALPHVWIALAYLELDDPGQAHRHLQRALEIQPESGLARIKLQALRATATGG